MADADRKLWLHFDGLDGGTAVVDSSPVAKTITPAGAFELDDAQSKFGPTSGHFSTVNDVLTVTDHDDFALGAAWTIEVWARLSNAPGDLRFWRQSVDSTHMFLFHWVAGTSKLRILYRNSPVESDLLGDEISLTLNTWHHIAAAFDGTTARLFFNGSLVGSLVSDYTIPDFAANPTINYAGIWEGHIDELVVGNICKYTGNFTPQGPILPHMMQYCA